MDDIQNTASLADFRRCTPKQIREMRKSGRSFVLTVAGKPSLVVQDAKAYERLLAAIDRAEAVAGVKRGMASFARGEGQPARAALAESLNNYRCHSRTSATAKQVASHLDHH